MDWLDEKLIKSPLPEATARLNTILFAALGLLAGGALTNWAYGTGTLGLSDDAKNLLIGFWWIALVLVGLLLILNGFGWWVRRHRIDGELLMAAKVKRAKDLKIGVGRHGGDVLIPDYDKSVYQLRDVDENARVALNEHHAVILRGSSQTGKTRIAANCLLADPKSVVIQPRQETPPAFSSRGLAGRTVYLFLDDLHSQVGRWDAHLWWERTRDVCGDRARLVATTWPGDDWDRVKETMPAFVRTVGEACIVDASPFSRAEGLKLYGQLDKEEDFDSVWDGTPGGLVIGLKARHERYERLKSVNDQGVRGSSLLDAAKILTDAQQPQLKETTLRGVVETIIGSTALTDDQWQELKDQTTEGGFGSFENSIFASYSSYVSSGSIIVDYEPTVQDFVALESVLVEEGDWVSLLYYALAAQNNRKLMEIADRTYERAISVDGGNNLFTLGNYAIFLTDIRKGHDRAEAMYERALAADPEHANTLGNYANFLKNVRHDHDRAEAMYERALAADPEHANTLGNYANFLTDIRKAHDRAEAMYERALAADPNDANVHANLTRLLLARGKDERGYVVLDSAFTLELESEPPEVSVELWFYVLAHHRTPQERLNGISELRRLLESGARSPGWDLSANVAQAVKHSHEDTKWLSRLAGVISDGLEIGTLDDWPAWCAADDE